MAKNADGPPSGRMGFGYQAAADAGVPWEAVKPRSVEEVNAELQARRAERAKIDDEVGRLCAEHPKLRERAATMVRLRWSAEDTLHQLRKEARELNYRRSVLKKR